MSLVSGYGTDDTFGGRVSLLSSLQREEEDDSKLHLDPQYIIK